MSYEPGSPECRSLIEAKDNILNAIKSIKGIESTNHLHSELMKIYNELEGIHELRRNIENTNS